MKLSARLTVSFLLVVMICTAIIDAPIAAKTAVTMRLYSSAALPGGEFEISLLLLDNPGIASVRLSIEYDDTVMEMTAAEITETFAAAPNAQSVITQGNPIVINWLVYTGQVDTDACFAILHFVVKESATPGEYPFVITYDPYDFVNEELKRIDVIIDSGKLTVIDPSIHTKHEWDNNIYWEWADDGSWARLGTKCMECGAKDMVEASIIRRSIQQEPNCTEGGVVSCRARGRYFDRYFYSTRSIALPATGHIYGEPVWTWSEDSSAASAAFACSGGDDTQTVTAAVTSETTQPTHTEDGKTVYTAKAVFQTRTYTDTRKVVLPATGHSYGAPVWTWSADYSTATATFTCTGGDDTQTVTATVSSVTTEPTHTQEGKTVYTATAAFLGQTYTDSKEVTLPATGHSYGAPVWTWSADYSTATATFTCTGGDDTQTVTATVDITITDATLIEDGKCMRIASVEFQGKTYSVTVEETLLAPVEWTLTVDGNNATISVTGRTDDPTVLIIAMYDANGRFMDMLPYELAGMNYSISISLVPGNRVEAFFLHAWNDPIPLCHSIRIN